EGRRPGDAGDDALGPERAGYPLCFVLLHGGSVPAEHWESAGCNPYGAGVSMLERAARAEGPAARHHRGWGSADDARPELRGTSAALLEAEIWWPSRASRGRVETRGRGSGERPVDRWIT